LFAFGKGKALSKHTVSFDPFVLIVDGNSNILDTGETIVTE